MPENITGHHQFEDFTNRLDDYNSAQDCENLPEVFDSIASVKNWILFSDAVEAHVEQTQRDKYAEGREIQTIDAVVKSYRTLEEKLAFMLGTIHVYVYRYLTESKEENRVYDKRDLLKAAHYLAMAWGLDK